MADNDTVGLGPHKSPAETNNSTPPTPAFLKIRAVTEAAHYLANAGPPSARGIGQTAQNLWFRLVLLGGKAVEFSDGRVGIEVLGRKTRLAALASDMACTPRTVSRAMAELEDCGIIERRRMVRGFLTRVLLPDQAVARAAAARTETKASVRVTASRPVKVEAPEAPEAVEVEAVAAVHEDTDGGHEDAGVMVHEDAGVMFHEDTGVLMMNQTKDQTKVQKNLGLGPQGASAREATAGGWVARRGSGPGGRRGVGSGGADDGIDDAGRLLRKAGVSVKAVADLAAEVVRLPGWRDDLPEVVEALRCDPTVKNPAGVLRSRIAAGSLRPMTKRTTAGGVAAGGPVRVNEPAPGDSVALAVELVERVTGRIRDAEAAGVRLILPPRLRDLCGLNGNDALVAEGLRVKAKSPADAAEYLRKLESAIRAPGGDRREASPDADPVSVVEVMRSMTSAEAMRRGLSAPTGGSVENDAMMLPPA